MKELGLKSYRFSVSWPRVMPEGYGTVNEKGLQFYIDLVNELTEAGIEPMVTLFHWNLPTAIYELGGWENPQVVDWFEQYTDVVTTALGKKVKYWMTFNEPQLFIGAGLNAGVFAPFEKKSTEALMRISKNVYLAHGKAVRIIRKNCQNSIVGMAPTGEIVIPRDMNAESIERARKLSFSMKKESFTSSITWWSDPIFFGKIPEDAQAIFGECLPVLTEEEWEIVTEPLDFYGFNIYQGLEDLDSTEEYGPYAYPGSPKTSMDWNVTARLRSPYVKVFEEEREMTVVLLIDISRSGLFGTSERTKRDLIAEIAAVLSFSAIINNDKVGALFFSDRVEEFIPPKKGRSHLLHIIREIIELKPKSNGTDVGQALRYLTNAMKKKCTAFVLSDMLDANPDGSPRYEDALKVARNRHDISVIKVHDPRERTIPDVGLVHVKDSETGESAWINTSSKRTRAEYSKWFGAVEDGERKLFNRYKIDSVDIATNQDYVKGLMTFFGRR